MGLQDQQLQQLILDFGQLGGLVAQDGDLERHHRGQLAEDVVHRDERVVRDGVQREGLPVFDRDRSWGRRRCVKLHNAGCNPYR